VLWDEYRRLWENGNRLHLIWDVKFVQQVSCNTHEGGCHVKRQQRRQSDQQEKHQGVIDKKQEIRTFNPSLTSKWNVYISVETNEAVEVGPDQVVKHHLCP
jgi:hypothetical protein